MIVCVTFTSACSWFGRKRVTESLRRETALRVQNAIESAAGSRVWVKGAPTTVARSAPAPGSEISSQALVLPDNYDQVLGAIERYAETARLEAQVSHRNFKQGLRSSEIVLRQRNELVCRWRVREVPQLRRAAIVIDDLGQDLEAARALLRQPYPLTFSVLPALRYSTETAREAHSAGRDVMLHLPMEPEPGSGANPGPGEIRMGMSGDTVAETIRQDLSSVPFAAGANNHMGSRATSDAALMGEVMKVLAVQGLFFVDSRTTAETEALNEARRIGIPAFYRSVFLDDTETVPYTLQQLRLFRRTVEEQGTALAIGHPHATTIEALTEFLPEFERADIQLVPASQLVRLPEAARLEPPGRQKLEGQ